MIKLPYKGTTVCYEETTHCRVLVNCVNNGNFSGQIKIMPEKKISPCIFSKLLTGGLLIFVLSANHTAVANDGIKPYGTTLVLAAGQYPEAVKKYNPSRVYVSYLMSSSLNKFEGVFLHKDTITNLKKFTDTLGKGMGGFRLIFQSSNTIDSVWELGRQFEIALTAYPLEGDLLKIVNLGSSSKKVDEFIFNYGQKFSDEGNTRGRSDGAETGMLERLLRKYEIYDSYDRNKYAVAAVWVLSVGIDDYGVIKYRTCSSDAQSYIKFFEDQHTRGKSSSVLSSLFHEYVLLDRDATKEAILNALKEISRKATLNDVFIFNFSGCSIVLKNDSPDAGTYFYPYDIEVIDRKNTIRNRNSKDTTNAFRNCISLKLLQEYISLYRINTAGMLSTAWIIIFLKARSIIISPHWIPGIFMTCSKMSFPPTRSLSGLRTRPIAVTHSTMIISISSLKENS